MPFNKQQLTDDFLAGLAQEVAEDDDATRDMLRGVAEKLAIGVEKNPGATVLTNEDKIKILEDDLAALQSKVNELQSFVDSIEQRVTAEEQVTGKLKPTALN